MRERMNQRKGEFSHLCNPFKSTSLFTGTRRVKSLKMDHKEITFTIYYTELYEEDCLTVLVLEFNFWTLKFILYTMKSRTGDCNYPQQIF